MSTILQDIRLKTKEILQGERLKNLNITSGDDLIDSIYTWTVELIKTIANGLIPYLRRVLRFIALPYCYIKLVNWETCTVSRFQVAKDFFYIFFKLKYFPDNYSKCRLWEKDRRLWKNYYGSIYEPFQRGRLRKEVQPKEYIILFENKYVCYQLCKAEQLPLPILYGVIDVNEDYKSFIRSILGGYSERKIIIKPVMGKGGKGINLAYSHEGNIYVRGQMNNVLLDNFQLGSCSVVQEYITQHELVSTLSTSSNTVRIQTLLTKGKEVIIVGAFMKIGLQDGFVDNLRYGGIGVGIDIHRGVLNEIAYDFKGGIHHEHPTSGKIFAGFHIPYWQDVVHLAKRIQKAFPFYKFLGYDIAISSEGPIIIEINAEPDNVVMEFLYGPILANERIRKEFKQYNLLINN